MTQQIKRGWRMMLGIWFLLMSVLLPGCKGKGDTAQAGQQGPAGVPAATSTPPG